MEKDSNNQEYILDDGFSEQVLKYVKLKKSRRRKFLLSGALVGMVLSIRLISTMGWQFSGVESSLMETNYLSYIAAICLSLCFLGFIVSTEGVVE